MAWAAAGSVGGSMANSVTSVRSSSQAVTAAGTSAGTSAPGWSALISSWSDQSPNGPPSAVTPLAARARERSKTTRLRAPSPAPSRSRTRTQRTWPRGSSSARRENRTMPSRTAASHGRMVGPCLQDRDGARDLEMEYQGAACHTNRWEGKAARRGWVAKPRGGAGRLGRDAELGGKTARRRRASPAPRPALAAPAGSGTAKSAPPVAISGPLDRSCR